MARRPIDQKKLMLLKRKRELLKRARKIAKMGSYLDFGHVRRQFDQDDDMMLRLWATASERDEIDQLCGLARLKLQ